jgi:hypothetical protein
LQLHAVVEEIAETRQQHAAERASTGLERDQLDRKSSAAETTSPRSACSNRFNQALLFLGRYVERVFILIRNDGYDSPVGQIDSFVGHEAAATHFG